MRKYLIIRKTALFLWLATFLFSFISLPADASESAYSLRYNTVMDANGHWVTQGGAYCDKWLKYNCYAFAIGRVENPNFYPKSGLRQYDPGDINGEGSFSDNQTIDQLANIVVADLVTMGYSNVETSPTIPTISSSQELICVRRSTYIDNDSEEIENDYHFMRYDLETNAWYHKPGNTAVLRYNGIPSNDVPWYREASFYGEEDTDAFVYNSDIVYITYTKNQFNIVDDIETSVNIDNWVHLITDRMDLKYAVDVYYELNFGEYDYYNITLESDYNFEYDIFTTSNDILNTDFAAIRTGNGTSINTSINKIEGNKYYLRINFTTDVASSVDVTVEHRHEYSHEPCGSATHHLCVCNCGYETQARHVVERTSAKRAPCLQCGQMVLVANASIGTMGDVNLPEVA